MPTAKARVSILGIMGLIGLLGIGFAALSSPSAFWASAVLTLNVTMLVVALIGWVTRRDPGRRAFWAGFFLAGATYLVVSRAPWEDESQNSRLRQADLLVTTMLLDFLYTRIEPSAPPPTTVAPGPTMGGTSGAMLPGMGGMGMVYNRIGQAPPPPTKWSLWSRPDRWKGQEVMVASNYYVSIPIFFLRIGHSLFSILFGIMGGLLERRWRCEGEAASIAGQPVG